MWPYDEGGCGCSHDWPWGAKGFPRISAEMAAMARTIYPAIKVVISTWTFDKPLSPGGSEYVGLDGFIKAEVAATGGSNFTFVMVDDHGNFPRWPV